MRERSEATEDVLCLQAKKPLHTGVCTGCLSITSYLVSLAVSLSVCLSVCVTTFISSFLLIVARRAVVYTRPISTNNPGSMEPGEYGLTLGSCFVACRLEVIAVAGLLWISWCVWGAVGFISCFPLIY